MFDIEKKVSQLKIFIPCDCCALPGLCFICRTLHQGPLGFGRPYSVIPTRKVFLGGPSIVSRRLIRIESDCDLGFLWTQRRLIPNPQFLSTNTGNCRYRDCRTRKAFRRLYGLRNIGCFVRSPRAGFPDLTTAKHTSAATPVSRD